jgi:GGDEF domain-containing protein
LLLTAGAITFLRERPEASEERFRRLAESDPLTGVGNYRMLLQRIRPNKMKTAFNLHV